MKGETRNEEDEQLVLTFCIHTDRVWIIIVLVCISYFVLYMFFFCRFVFVYLNVNCGNVQSGEGVVRGSLV